MEEKNKQETQQGEQQKERPKIIRKIRSALKYGSLGIIGYASTIVWTVPFREAQRFSWYSPTFESEMIMNLLAIVLGTITFGVLFFIFSDKEIEYIDVHIPSKKDGIIIIGGTVAVLLTIYLLTIITTVFDTGSSQHSIIDTGQGNINPTFVLLLVPLSFLAIAPSEEFIFRNIVQKGLYSEYTKISAILISSIIFAIVHIPAYATGSGAEILVSLTHVLILSAVLGGVYAYTENLMMPIIIHGTYNAGIFFAWYLELEHGIIII